MKLNKPAFGIVLFSLLAVVGCKKSKHGGPADIALSLEEEQVERPNDPINAKSIGFFLDDWSPKTFSPPAFDEFPKPSATISATVHLDLSTVITKVPKYIFGNNTNPYMEQMVTAPVLIEHIRNLSPNVLRFPGGNISSIYFWNAAPGEKPADAPDELFNEQGQEADAFYWYGKNNESWTLSLDNYYAALAQTGSTGIITVNYGYARYGTSNNPVAKAAHLAADWVRYDNGRTKFWEIGNESAGVWQAGYRINTAHNKDGQPQVVSGALYGEHFQVFVDSMKKAAAEVGSIIKIGGQLIQYNVVNSWESDVDRQWNSGFLTKAGNLADFFIVHSYFTPFNQNSTPSVILNSAASETKSIMDWMKTTTQNAGAEMKPIALTEWNIFAVGSKQSVSHVSGLHATMVLGELLKNQFGMASRWDLANGWDNGNDHGMFNKGDEPDGVAKWNPRPAFYHMYYFQKYFGDRMVPSTSSGSSIVSYASSYSSGEAGVILVNTGQSAQTVKITTKNFNPGNRYYWFTLAGDNDNNGFSRKVLINGTGPVGAAGGPSNYLSLKAFSASAKGEIKVSVPAMAAVYMVIENKNS